MLLLFFHTWKLEVIIIIISFLAVLMGDDKQQQQLMLCWDTRTTHPYAPLVTGIVAAENNVIYALLVSTHMQATSTPSAGYATIQLLQHSSLVQRTTESGFSTTRNSRTLSYHHDIVHFNWFQISTSELVTSLLTLNTIVM